MGTWWQVKGGISFSLNYTANTLKQEIQMTTRFKKNMPIKEEAEGLKGPRDTGGIFVNDVRRVQV